MEGDKFDTIKALRILYPIWVVVGMFGLLYVPSTLIESGDAMKTSENILNNVLLFRIGIFARLLTQLLHIVIPLLLFKLFKSLNREMSVLMIILALVSVPISMYNETNMLFILKVLGQPAEILIALNMYNQSILISLMFWGLWLFPLGWLVYKSSYFPKMVGISLYIAGAGYVLESFLKILFPELKSIQGILELMTFGELIFIIWLVLVGIRKSANT